MKKAFKFLGRLIWVILKVIYFPIYLVFFIAYKVIRLALAFIFCGLLEFRYAKDVFKSLFEKPIDYEK